MTNETVAPSVPSVQTNPPIADTYTNQHIPIRLTVLDGKTTTRYVYKSVLCSRAAIFIGLTRDADCVEFPDWRAETLESFVTWVNCGRVLVRGLNAVAEIDVDQALTYGYETSPDDKNVQAKLRNEEVSIRPLPANAPWYASSFGRDPIAHVLARVIDVYSFAQVGHIPTLATECVLVTQRLLCAPRNVLVYAPLIKAAIDRSGSVDNDLCNFLLEWTAYRIHDDV